MSKQAAIEMSTDPRGPQNSRQLVSQVERCLRWRSYRGGGIAPMTSHLLLDLSPRWLGSSQEAFLLEIINTVDRISLFQKTRGR